MITEAGEQTMLTLDQVRHIVFCAHPDMYLMRTTERRRYSATRTADETTYVIACAEDSAGKKSAFHLGTLAKLSKMSETDLVQLVQSKFTGEDKV